MATLFVKFPAGQQAQAEAYAAACDAAYIALMDGRGLARQDRWFAPTLARDGMWTVPLYGPPWSPDEVEMIAEPAECEALRGEALVVDQPNWRDPLLDAL